MQLRRGRTFTRFAPTIEGHHASCSNHFVAGGAVKGGRYYGTWPTPALGGADGVGNNGHWIPTTAVDQYAATHASRFGVDAGGLAAVLPNLTSFAPDYTRVHLT
jgi:uncharacterized protein (DUF1501 family)